jgi:ribosomal protein S18 acetylase RimI-like enzyme
MATDLGWLTRHAAAAGVDAPQFDLRPARDADMAFAERLYVGTMAPLLARLDALDEAGLVSHLAQICDLTEVLIVIVEGREAGWLQVHETDQDINLSQIHLESAFRNRGVGTALVRRIQARGQSVGKTVSLSVVRNNPAVSLYRRLGFRIIGEDGLKLHMLWQVEAPPSDRPASKPTRSAFS